MIADPGADIERSRRALANFLPGKAKAALSFPHGRYSSSVIDAARSAGFQLLFTSDAILNGLADGRPTRLLGRIEIPGHRIADRHGRLQSHRLATWLFLRPRRRLGAVTPPAPMRSRHHE
jgi:peptidoglycan/xylan/chitin deacetylase (PgdA/CDA1 family)